MNVPFFDFNPEIVSELRGKDHHSKAYKKLLQKVLIEIGGPVYLLNNLKTTEDGDRLRKKYFQQLIVSGVFIIAMFVWIVLALVLIGDKEIDQFVGSDIAIFIGFIAIECISVFLALFFAFRCKGQLLQGVSYLIDNYQQENSGTGSQTLSSYKFERSKVNKIAIIVAVAAFVIVYGVISLGNGTISHLFSAKTQEFTKAGMSITLTQDFHEQEVVSQTATYASSKYIVICLKEEFLALEQGNVPSDISLTEYAEAIIMNNSIEAEVAGSENRPEFVYSRQINGKEFSYLVTVFRGSDAYWTVSFACESKNFESSQKQFSAWADTVKVA